MLEESRKYAQIGVMGASGAVIAWMIWKYMLIDDEKLQDKSGQKVPLAKILQDESGQKVPLVKVGDGTLLLDDYMAGLNELARKSSKTENQVGYFDYFGMPIVLLTSPQHVDKAMKENVAHALWGGLKPASEAFFGQQVLFVLEGQEWRKLRGILRRAFTPQKLPNMSSVVTGTADALVKELLENFNNQIVDMHLACSMYHLSAISKVAFDYDLDLIATFKDGPGTISESFEFLLSELPRRAFSPDESIREDYTSNNPDNEKWKLHASNVRNIIHQVVTKRIGDRKPNQVDLLESMILAYESEYGVALDTDVLVAALGDNLVEILFAGYNTAVVTMVTAIQYLLTTATGWYQRALEEVDQQAYQPGVKVSNYPVLNAIINETLRLVPPAPLIARELSTGFQLPNVDLPPGTVAWFPVMHLHTDSNSWGNDADDFNPARWLQSSPPCPSGSFMPFSLGARDCIGKHFATLESVNFLAVVLRNIAFTLPEGFNVKPTFTGFGLRPLDLNTNKVAMPLLVQKRGIPLSSNNR